MLSVHSHAPGRFSGAPIAIVDIGSNSVRLVAYEALTRAPTPLFNEKVLCGLGKGVATSGQLAGEAMDKALAALRCFRTMCRTMGVTDLVVVATAATRDAGNGGAFLARAREAIGADITLVGGAREAELSAKGVMSGFWQPDGLVGDLGGGSLELVDVVGGAVGQGVSLPIGGLALSDLSRGSPRRAVRIARDALAGAEEPLSHLRGRTLYAVGGTWRALARLHMEQRQYPLRVMQGYSIPAEDPDLFAALIERSETESPTALAAVHTSRRPLLAFGAVVLEEIIRLGRPRRIVVSASGVREGLLFERLSPDVRDDDPLLTATQEFNTLRSRDPAHATDLCGWTDVLLASLSPDEAPEQRRLRHAACLLSDLGWRTHPDYRGESALATVANAAFNGIDHAERCLLAATLFHRYEGLEGAPAADWRVLLPPAMQARAKLVGGAMRVAVQLSSAMGGVLPRTSLRGRAGRLTLRLPRDLADLSTARLASRLRQLARLLEREPEVVVEP